MTHRSLRAFVSKRVEALGSPRAVLEAFAREMFERRGMRAPAEWRRDARLAPPDAGVDDLLARDDALGVVYQSLNAPALEAAYRAASRDRRKFTADEIPAVTGLFTPRWVADHLLRETLGRTWRDVAHPDAPVPPVGRAASSLAPVPGGEGVGEGRARRNASLEAKAAQPSGRNALLAARPLTLPSPPSTGERVKRARDPREGAARDRRSSDGERVTHACDVRVLDPACGTMNFGLVAVDLLGGMYRNEMDQAGRPGWPAEPSVRREADVGPAILRHNLFGVDVDPTALWLARLTLAMRLRVDPASTPMNLQHADALFDEIGGAGTGGFDVVVTNPPYLSARNLAPAVVARLKMRYPAAWRDLYACFIERCLDLCCDGGRVGLLTMQSFMFTGAFARLRGRVDARAAVETLLHLGPGLFDAGNPGTLQTVAFTLRREPDEAARQASEITATRLTGFPDSAAKEAALRAGVAPVFRVRQSTLAELPRRAWAYWATPAVRRAFAAMPTLRDVAPPRQGLATTDNARFVRFWWEVEPTRPDAPRAATPGRWFPYAKSGRFRRWYEAPRHRVNWEHDGSEIKDEIVRRYPYLDGDWQWVAKNATWYGRPGGVTYSYLTSGRFSARRLEPGSIFDVAGSSLFPPGDPLTVLAVLNSSVAAELLSVINPTVNFQVGDLAELPVPREADDALAGLARDAIGLQQHLDTFDETSPDFRQPMPWTDRVPFFADASDKLREVERQVDLRVAEIYKMDFPPLLPARREGRESCGAADGAGSCTDAGTERYAAKARIATAAGTTVRGANPGLREYAQTPASVGEFCVLPRRLQRSALISQPVSHGTGGRDFSTDLARRWASFAIGRVLGRWGGRRGGEPMLEIRPALPRVRRAIRDEIAGFNGGAAVDQIERALGGLERFLAADFYPWHVRLYAKRPIYWAFGDRRRAMMLAHDAADADAVRAALRRVGGALPAGWERHVDDGIAASLAPLVAHVAEPALAKALAKVAADQTAGRLAWSRTSGAPALVQLQQRPRTATKLPSRRRLADREVSA